MAKSADLLPPSIADTRSLAMAAVLDRLDTLPMAVVDQLYDPDLCHEEALTPLGHQFGVLDGGAWSLASTLEAKRGLVKQALQLQKRRGTPWAMKQALASIGWPGLAIQERTTDWAHFKVYQPIGGRSLSLADLALLIPVINAWKPARCILDAIELGVVFTSEVVGAGPRYDAAHLHDGAILYEGSVLDTISYVKVGAGAPSVVISGLTVAHFPDHKVITFNVDTATANGLALDSYSIHTAGGTVIATATAAPVSKTSDVSLAITWTLNIV